MLKCHFISENWIFITHEIEWPVPTTHYPATLGWNFCHFGDPSEKVAQYAKNAPRLQLFWINFWRKTSGCAIFYFWHGSKFLIWLDSALRLFNLFLLRWHFRSLEPHEIEIIAWIIMYRCSKYYTSMCLIPWVCCENFSETFSKKLCFKIWWLVL